MAQAIIPHSDQELAGTEAIFDKAVAIVLDTLSPTSRRVYHRTYRAWSQFATEHNFDVMALTLDNIRAFIHEADVAKTTRQNRLSHMRKLLELLAIGDGQYRQHYNAVKSFLRVQANEGDRSRPERVKRALNPHEATALLGVWRNDTSHVGIRNDVMIRLLVYAGLRRSELIALRWSDINVENLTITVRHGKGDKERVVALVDPSEGTTRAIQALQDAQGGDYTYVFPSMTRGRKATWAADTPTVDQTVMRVVAQTAKRAGLGELAPHDLRRTHITEGLNTGATVADMQAQAGHANAATTLRYAQATDAVQRRHRINFRFA